MPDDIYLAAARAYCAAKFTYTGPYVDPDGAAQHLERDARDTAEHSLWLCPVVDAVLEALKPMPQPWDSCPECAAPIVRSAIIRGDGPEIVARDLTCEAGHHGVLTTSDPPHWHLQSTTTRGLNLRPFPRW